MNLLVSVTPAQWRTLVKMARGKYMPVSRYNEWTSPQLRSLERKRCAVVADGRWVVTRFGRELLANRGKSRWVDEDYAL